MQGEHFKKSRVKPVSGQSRGSVGLVDWGVTNENLLNIRSPPTGPYQRLGRKLPIEAGLKNEERRHEKMLKRLKLVDAREVRLKAREQTSGLSIKN